MGEAIQELGPYRLDVLLGRGGMGEVYRAWDRRLERWVAIKRLLKTDDAVARARFLREARAAARLGHPGILQVFDILEEDGTDWIVMEMVDGPDLATLLRDGPLDLGLVLDYGRQIAAALAAAHAEGILHRDLKTENVMVLSSGHTKVLDFGLAKRLDLGNGDGAPDSATPKPKDSQSMVSFAGHIVGTPRAMSPEQTQGHDLDLRSDLFALGILLYELSTARSPFQGRSLTDTLKRVLSHQQPSLQRVDPRIPAELSDLVDQLLEKDPGHRTAEAAVVAETLAEIAAENPRFRISRASVPSSEAPSDVAIQAREEAVLKTLLISDLLGNKDQIAEASVAGTDLYARHNRLVRDLLNEHGAFEMTRGDASLMTLDPITGTVPLEEDEDLVAPSPDSNLLLFDRPWNAVQYALAYHQSLRELGLAARVGIHLGEVILRHSSRDAVERGATPVSLEGLARPAAERLMALAESGQTLLTRAAYEVAMRSDTGVDTEDLCWIEHGLYHFPGVAGDLDVFEVGIEGEAPLRAPAGRAESRQETPLSQPEPRSITLKSWTPPELPDQPYPVLLPYRHPDLMAGREDEIENLCVHLQMSIPILGLGAPSGTGKSSLLLGGLIPRLRSQGRPVALVRHPQEPGIVGRLLGDLLAGIEDDLADDDWRGFVERLAEVERLAGEAPLLILDQFESVLRADVVVARTRLGRLLAATAERRPGIETPLCRWLLVYRSEAHGETLVWLQDVLLDARKQSALRQGVEELPRDLSGPERFQSLTLSPFATPPATDDPLAAVTRIFQAAIEQPLDIREPNGEPHYSWRFAPGDAERLASTFAEARLARLEAPLVPELQVVLAHCLARSSSSEGLLQVPEDLDGLVEDALADHLRRALEAAFPGDTSQSATLRARALLALHELAMATGQDRTTTAEDGIAAETLARAIGQDGEGILEQLATPLTRLVILQDTPAGLRYVLSHDRMAEVVVRMTEEQGRHGKLVVDDELLDLRRFVYLKTSLFRSQEAPSDQNQGQPSEVATRLPRRHFRKIAENEEALLWDESRRTWWAACRERRRIDRRRIATRTTLALLLVVLVSWTTWSQVKKARQHTALLEQVAGAEPWDAMRAFAQLVDEGTEAQELLASLRRRETAMEALASGLGAIPEARRSAVVLQAVEIALPWVMESSLDPALIANLVWALDYAPVRDPLVAERARVLRDQVLAPLRELRPPPPLPGVDEPDWVEVPAGTFLMGSPDGEGDDNERPPHQVTVSAFRIQRHEVTNAELRRLLPEHRGEDDLPAAFMSWYTAYTYASWLGGRLPTEAEWEYAARADCRYAFCTRDGLETTVDAVAWTERSSDDVGVGLRVPQPVMRLEPNPWGLYDMLGNVWEWTADWYGDYSDHAQLDPKGPLADPEGGFRASRGGGVEFHPRYARFAARDWDLPGHGDGYRGLRVVLPSAVTPPSH